jgi:two-component system, OmpR family, response regulator
MTPSCLLVRFEPHRGLSGQPYARCVTSATIGICEDDDELRGLLRDALEREGHRVRATATGTAAVASYSQPYPDLLVLDIGLPDADGRDVCQALRAHGMTAPVVFLTARDALTDRLSGFKAGGDDYLIKPFALAELIVRIEAVLRRATSSSPDPREGLALDPSQHAVVGPAGQVSLTPTEFRILATLASDQGSVVRRSILVGAAWPDGATVSDNTLDAYVSRLRGKLREAAVEQQIGNVRGVGYALR